MSIEVEVDFELVLTFIYSSFLGNPTPRALKYKPRSGKQNKEEPQDDDEMVDDFTDGSSASESLTSVHSTTKRGRSFDAADYENLGNISPLRPFVRDPAIIVAGVRDSAIVLATIRDPAVIDAVIQNSPIVVATVRDSSQSSYFEAAGVDHVIEPIVSEPVGFQARSVVISRNYVKNFGLPVAIQDHEQVDHVQADVVIEQVTLKSSSIQLSLSGRQPFVL